MLTIPQKKYLIKRIDEVAEAKINELLPKDDYTVSDKKLLASAINLKLLSFGSKEMMVKVLMTELTSDTRAWNNSGTIQIDAFVPKWKEFKENHKNEKKRIWAKRMQKQQDIYDEATKIKDQAMFGTEEEAYLLMESFQEMKI
jgi:hypothetical protein